MKKTFAPFILCILFIAAPLTARPADFNSQLPPELSAWQKEITELLGHFGTIDSSEAAAKEAAAAVETSRQKFYPTLSAGSQVGRSRTNADSNNGQNLTSGPDNDLQLSLSLRQNIFSGGVDWQKLTIAQKRETAARLRATLAKRTHVRQWLKDVASILHQQQIVALQTEAATQAKALKVLASRKEASGFLGRRDLLDSERELLRVEQETLQANNTLQELLTRFSSVYRIAFSKTYKTDDFKIFLSNSADAHPEKFKPSDDAERLLPLVLSELEVSLAEEDATLASRGRFSPRIDLSAQALSSRQLNDMPASSGSVNKRGSATGDSTRSWSLSVSGELVFNPPTAFGALEEARARISSARISQQSTRESIVASLNNTHARLQQVREQKRSYERLLTLTRQLHEKNQRLFEAGELSIDRLIASQQTLSRDTITLASIGHDELRLAIDISLSRSWNLAPAGSTLATTP